MSWCKLFNSITSWYVYFNGEIEHRMYGTDLNYFIMLHFWAHNDEDFSSKSVDHCSPNSAFSVTRGTVRVVESYVSKCWVRRGGQSAKFQSSFMVRRWCARCVSRRRRCLIGGVRMSPCRARVHERVIDGRRSWLEYYEEYLEFSKKSVRWQNGKIMGHD